jgi:hypothetical protein
MKKKIKKKNLPQNAKNQIEIKKVEVVAKVLLLLFFWD